MKKVIRVVLGIAVIFIGIGIIASLSNQEETIKTDKEKYVFVEEGKIIEEGNEYFKTKYITGTIKNTTEKTTNYIQITFNLYDKDGNVISSAFDNINQIEPGGTWKFKAAILEENFDSFKLGSVTGF